MDGLRTLGQPAATAAVRALLGAGFPHAVLLAGPSGVGKSTLALDIAAALLCVADDVAARPCRTCRGCRMVDHGNHPDVHRLAPSGAGSAISIGGRGERGVRDLVSDLALLPVEGGARVAIIEAAQRMSEDAQSALLKTLEEPPAGTTVLLCADDEERLLPTIRSRCVRIRLGPLGIRDVEAVLVDHGVADAPTAARLARITDGRPGHAIAYALAPGAATIRGEIARTLLDLLGAGLTARLTGIRELAGRAADLGRELDAGMVRVSAGSPEGTATPAARGSRTGRSTRAGGRAAPSAGSAGSAGTMAATGPGANEPGTADAAGDGAETTTDGPAARVPAAERRRGALVLIGIWRSILRDLALAGQGATDSVRDLELIDDLGARAGALASGRAGELLRDLDLAGERLEGNVSPELVLDVLALRWTAARRAA
ncbi:MAG: AAA family ATPase [Chloroflexota bacterium]|nr:MAG: AAA family ATPase [Chloroflexota bacterium]